MAPDFTVFLRPTSWVLLFSVAALLADVLGLAAGETSIRRQSLLLTLGAQILGYTLLHGRWWDSLPSARRTVDPLPAVLRCLVPGYNLVWFRTAYVTLTEDLNAELTRVGLRKRASPALARLYVFVYYGLTPAVAVLPLLGVDTSGWLHLAVDGLALASLGLYIRDTNEAAAWLRAAAAAADAAPAPAASGQPAHA